MEPQSEFPWVGSLCSRFRGYLLGLFKIRRLGVAALPTLPFVTSSVSATLEHEGKGHTDSVTNLRTIRAPQRFVISLDSSDHSGANIAEAKVDSFTRPFIPLMTVATTDTSIVDPATTVKEKFVESSIFGGGSSSGGGADHTVSSFSDLTGSGFIVGGIHDGRTCREMVDEFAPPKFSTSIRGMEHDQLFMEFNVGAARQMSFSAEVRMHAKYNIIERRRLNSVMKEKNSLLKARDEEIKNLKAWLLVKEAKAAEAIRLRAEASKFKIVEQSLRDEVKVHELETSFVGLQEKVTAYENFIDQLKKFQDEKMQEVNEKFDKLCADFVEMGLHLEEKFYPHLLTTIFGRRWLLTHGVELAIAKCLNSTEYLSALGAAISKVIEKGIHEGLSTGITHGTEGRQLTDVAAYNPSAEADYLTALQRLQSVTFSLLAELRANKDASVETIMNLLRLEDTLAERLCLIESQPHVNQLMVPIHHSPDQRFVGAFALSLSLDVSSARVRKIKENIANHISALRDVFVPLSEPLSAIALGGTKGTFGTALDITTALSTTFTFASTIIPISVDDYEATNTKDQAVADENVVVEDNNPFPNVDDVELITSR
ncbi:hypothetical protein Tco_0494636 [Tanacetum coccineum]